VWPQAQQQEQGAGCECGKLSGGDHAQFASPFNGGLHYYYDKDEGLRGLRGSWFHYEDHEDHEDSDSSACCGGDEYAAGHGGLAGLARHSAFETAPHPTPTTRTNASCSETLDPKYKWEDCRLTRRV
jgi:hypothetical protein